MCAQNVALGLGGGLHRTAVGSPPSERSAIGAHRLPTPLRIGAATTLTNVAFASEARGGGVASDDAARTRGAPAAGGEPWVSALNVALGLGSRRTIAAQRLRRSALPHQAMTRRRFPSSGLASERGGRRPPR